MKHIIISLLSVICLSGAVYGDIFMQFKNSETQGESQDADHKNWVDLMSFSSGIENSINIGSISGGGGAGKASFKVFTVEKLVDKASVALMAKCATGNHYDEVVIEVTRPGEAGVRGGNVILRIELKLVMVQEIGMDHSDGEAGVSENVIFQYGAHRITTFSPNAQGELAQSGQHQWSIVLNNESFSVQ